MLGQLPKLFDRNFVIGYFLPVVIFAAASFGLIARFDLLSSLPPLSRTDSLLADVTIILLLLWLVSVALLVTNRSAYRLVEGYGRFNPARLFARKERKRYHKFLDRKKELEAAYHKESNNPTKQAKILFQLTEIGREIAEEYPDDDMWLMPTRFGNTMRAFETYSRVVYGFEAIEGWSRLLAVIPKEYRELVDDAKAQTDFWLNLWVVSLFSVIEYLSFAIYMGPKVPWFPVAALGVTFFTSWRVRKAAVEWGDAVKATFDTFLPELAKKLNFPSNITHDEERKLWQHFSKVIIYRSKDDLHRMDDEIARLPREAKANDSASESYETYIVQNGETIKDIAQHFGTTEEAITKANGDINDYALSPGQRLRVP